MTPSDPRQESRLAKNRHTLTLASVTLACLLPFLGKAFNIDDPLFIWAAQHIRTHPLDPFGFDVNWYGVMAPMSMVTKNPPLVCYCIALASWVVGWREVGIHALMLLPAVAAVLGTYRLAERMCSNPLLAALVSLFTPVFLISSTTVMCDVPMLAFWMWAVVFWIRGLDEQSRGKIAISALLIAAAALSKYYGIALIGLLAAYSLLRERRFGWWASYLVIPAAVLGVYQLATHIMYGRGLLVEAARYATSVRFAHGPLVIQTLLVGLAFAGGCLICVLFYAPLLWSRRNLIVGVVFALVVAGVLVKMGSLGKLSLVYASGGIRWASIAQISILATAGLGVVALSVSDLWRRRDADSLLLVAWVLGTLVFAAVINWTVNGRSILPAAPALGILMMRRIEMLGRSAASARSRWALVLLAPTALFALWVTCADHAFAGGQRTAAEQVFARYARKGRTIHAQGHWGFQYYMGSAGASQMDADSHGFRRGDVVAMPTNNVDRITLPRGRFEPGDPIQVPITCGMATMQCDMGAGFHADKVGGPLPFAIGSVPNQRVEIYLARASFYILGGKRYPDPAAKASGPYPAAELAQAIGLAKHGDCPAALRHFRAALARRPNDALLHYRVARTLHHANQISEAVREYRIALRLSPADWQSANNLAWILATTRDSGLRSPTEEVRWAESACRVTKQADFGVLDTLAVAYASAGRYDDAIATAERAAKLAQSRNDAAGAREIRGREQFYRAHKPYTP